MPQAIAQMIVSCEPAIRDVVARFEQRERRVDGRREGRWHRRDNVAIEKQAIGSNSTASSDASVVTVVLD
jgi:hypothetical protein